MGQPWIKTQCGFPQTLIIYRIPAQIHPPRTNVSAAKTPQKKPRLFLRFVIVFLLIAVIIGVLAYVKTGQIQVMIAQGSATPPPISVTVAEALICHFLTRIIEESAQVILSLSNNWGPPLL